MATCGCSCGRTSRQSLESTPGTDLLGHAATVRLAFKGTAKRFFPAPSYTLPGLRLQLRPSAPFRGSRPRGRAVLSHCGFRLCFPETRALSLSPSLSFFKGPREIKVQKTNSSDQSSSRGGSSSKSRRRRRRRRQSWSWGRRSELPRAAAPIHKSPAAGKGPSRRCLLASPARPSSAEVSARALLPLDF